MNTRSNGLTCIKIFPLSGACLWQCVWLKEIWVGPSPSKNYNLVSKEAKKKVTAFIRESKRWKNLGRSSWIPGFLNPIILWISTFLFLGRLKGTSKRTKILLGSESAWNNRHLTNLPTNVGWKNILKKLDFSFHFFFNKKTSNLIFKQNFERFKDICQNMSPHDSH